MTRVAVLFGVTNSYHSSARMLGVYAQPRKLVADARRQASLGACESLRVSVVSVDAGVKPRDEIVSSEINPFQYWMQSHCNELERLLREVPA